MQEGQKKKKINFKQFDVNDILGEKINQAIFKTNSEILSPKNKKAGLTPRSGRKEPEVLRQSCPEGFGSSNKKRDDVTPPKYSFINDSTPNEGSGPGSTNKSGKLSKSDR